MPANPSNSKKPRICDIDWSKLEFLNNGGYGRVYRVRPGLVVKVGELSREEVQRQRFFSAKRLAVPVYDFRDDVLLPPEIARYFCRRHTWHDDNYKCTCEEPHGALLMAEAVPARTCRNYGQIYRFIDRFKPIARTYPPGFNWDAHRGNVGLYKGRYVAFDFFDTSRRENTVGHSV